MVVLEEVNGDGQVTNRLEETVMVKYVRREIRTLTDDEREELLDAVSEHGKKQWKACCPLLLKEYVPGNIPSTRYRTTLWLVHDLISNIVPKKMGVPLVWRLKLAHYVPKIGKSNKKRCLATI